MENNVSEIAAVINSSPAITVAEVAELCGFDPADTVSVLITQTGVFAVSAEFVEPPSVEVEDNGN